MVKSKQGFTLLEIIMVVAISLALMAIAGTNYMDYKKNQALSNAAGEFTLDLQYARELSLKYESPVYIYLSADQYTLHPEKGYSLYSDKTVNLDREFGGVKLAITPSTAVLKVIPGGAFSNGDSNPCAFNIYTSYDSTGALPPSGRYRVLNIDVTGKVSGLGY
jgi:prepilin-type N-terminal cleavage/methylation domain-containing protein